MQKNHGFSLIELSIVLVIIGLIVGGVTAGSSLIKSARLQHVMGEVSDATQAIQLFKEKYHALPGDMANAESFWGSDPATCPAGAATPHSTTCNGNGDGFIGGADGASGYTEWYRAWQHLAAAGFISGEYDGVTGGGSAYNSLIEVNVPKSKLKGAGYTLAYQPPSNGTASLWAGKYGHVLRFGSQVTNADTSGPVLAPTDAHMIDGKIDDGLPAFGNVMAAPSGVYPYCTNNDNASSSAYDETQVGKNCGLIFLTGF